LRGEAPVTDERPLNTGNPYYSWEVDDEGRVVIYSECCADKFTPDMQWELFLALQEEYKRQGRI
jgi:hypothetical protein